MPGTRPPSDGSISALESRLGERVFGTSQFAGTEVMRIADLSDMEAQVNVNENDVINVKVGDHAKISVDAYPDRKIDGVVRHVNNGLVGSDAVEGRDVIVGQLVGVRHHPGTTMGIANHTPLRLGPLQNR